MAKKSAATPDKAPKETPLMKQYNEIKNKYPDACLLFRVGDFYETFGEDAVRAAGILGITLTKRGAGSDSETALAGFPHHSLNFVLLLMRIISTRDSLIERIIFMRNPLRK